LGRRRAWGLFFSRRGAQTGVRATGDDDDDDDQFVFVLFARRRRERDAIRCDTADTPSGRR
jgi:hypothetical protein